MFAAAPTARSSASSERPDWQANMRAVPPSYNKGNKNTDFVQRPAEKNLIEEPWSTTRTVVKF